MRLGVVIPVHGFAPYLAETLDGVFANRPDRVVLVDDGSPLPHEAPGDVELLRRDEAGGPATARAAGAALLADDVDLIALCDADDTWAPGHLDALRGALCGTPGAGWAFSRATIVGPDNRETGERWDRPPAGLLGTAELYAANPVPTSSVVLRRGALEAAGGFAAPVHTAEDWDLWLRLCEAGHPALCVEGPPIRYRRHPGGLTADVARLATDQRTVHEAHASQVDPEVAAAAISADRRALRRELLRRRLRRLRP